MTRYKCTECTGDLVQMLEREPWDDRPDSLTSAVYDGSKHYGFYCKFCHQMFREHWYLVKDGNEPHVCKEKVNE